ncbi:MAG: hypothetical protein RBU30_25695, partial [Polyangia bacterium]|nr:hypothetical protein [Polyangia bacterium]
STKTSEPKQPNGERYDYVALALASNEELEDVMRKGVQPDPAKIAGWEFKGWNTLDLTGMIGIRKFKKGFYQVDPASDPKQGIQGYNVQIVSNGLGDPWFDKIKKGNSIKHGWYDCGPVRLSDVDNKYPNGLLINYACGRNPPGDPSALLRDYIVKPYADNDDLMLGKAFIAIPGTPLRLFMSYFILERHNESTL